MYVYPENEKKISIKTQKWNKIDQISKNLISKKFNFEKNFKFQKKILNFKKI